MPKFRKKPVVIEAMQWHGHDEIECKIARYFRRPDIRGDESCRHCTWYMHSHGWIDTLEGGHIVCPGDWIITGVKGERYPCKPDIFVLTYEPVEDEGGVDVAA